MIVQRDLLLLSIEGKEGSIIQNESTRTLNDITALNHEIAKKNCWIVPYRINCNPIDLDFRVVCDETNNTAEVIDRNDFIADIYIKPAKSINYITLNFVATRSGIAFEEIGA